LNNILAVGPFKMGLSENPIRMRTRTNPLFLSALLLLSLLPPALRAGPIPKSNIHNPTADSKVSVAELPADRFKEEVSALYDQIDLKDIGLNKKAFEYAYKGYLYLVHHHLLNRRDVLSICDFSQSSRKKRLYVLDMEQKKVLLNTYVAHGRKSGAEYARSFSNNPKSHKSSLGFYITGQTYYGDHGLSLKIKGIERGFNDKAIRRNIVVHGSRYVGSDFLDWNAFNGRSFGCPALPYEESEQVIETIKNGSCLFIYHPTKKYITKSRILNG
jgi:L,D-transpeptidase catalytic domain